MMNGYKVLSGLAVTLMIIGVFAGVQKAEAADQINPVGILVEKIAKKFNLKQDEVQGVFNEVHAKRHEEREKQIESRLSQLVKDGKITDAQKKLILEKHEQMYKQKQENISKFQNMTPEQKRAEMQSKKDEMQKWSEQNGIDPQYLMPLGMRGMGGRFGKF